MAQLTIRRLRGASALAVILLAGCAADPALQQDGATAQAAPEGEPELASTMVAERSDARAVEPMADVVAEPEAMPAVMMTDAAPRCIVPRIRDLPAARARLADEQAALLAQEAARQRAQDDAAGTAPQGPIALQPSQDSGAGEPVAEAAPEPEPAPLLSDAAPEPMQADMAAALDSPMAGDEAIPIPAAALPGYDLSAEEAEAAFACILPELEPLYAASGHALARRWLGWQRLPQPPILVPDAFGMRWLTAFGTARAVDGAPPEGYLDRDFPVGAILAMPSFTVDEDGVVAPGGLVLVEKMQRGYSGPYGNWRFTEVSHEGRDIRPLVSRGGTDAPEPVVCADCTARGLDALYITLMEAGIAPDPERVAPLRDVQRPASWYPPRERTSRQGDVPAEEAPASTEAQPPAEEPMPAAPDITPPVTQTSMRG